MKYNAPSGSTDPDAGYQDRNTPGAVAGSKVPALAVETPQREIVAVIKAAGIDPSNTDQTQLLQAISQLISAATGGGGDANYVLMTQARLRLPIYPDVNTADGKLQVTSPSTGVVRLLPGYSFTHRGIFVITTVQADFATAGSKTYHLRWNKDAGYSLKDLADAAYNPGGLAEASSAFDSSFDDMLVARVSTNASNVATITALANKNDLALQQLLIVGNITSSNTESARGELGLDFNWARTPKNFTLTLSHYRAGSELQCIGVQKLGTSVADLRANAAVYDVTRYRISQLVLVEWMVSADFHFSARA